MPLKVDPRRCLHGLVEHGRQICDQPPAPGGHGYCAKHSLEAKRRREQADSLAKRLGFTGAAHLRGLLDASDGTQPDP